MKNAVATLALLSASCLGVDPLTAAEDALGPETRGVRPGPEHRPGQPCLVCHGPDGSAGDEEFVLAGTVYLTQTEPTGLGGARVLLDDDAGHTLTATTNSAGNFFVVRDGDDEEGGVSARFDIVFPIRVRVRYGDTERAMRSFIEREGSCAHCHGPSVDARSNGRVFVMEAAR
jgi:hypothetical protein